MNEQQKTAQWNRSFQATRLIFLICGICIAAWAPMVPYAKERLELNDAALGLVLLAFGVGALITMPLTGWLVHRFGIRNVSIISGLIMMGMLPFMASASTAASLSVFLFLFGASNGAMNVSMNSHAVAVDKSSDRPVMSGLHCFFSFGGLLGAAGLSACLEYGMGLFTCALSLSIIIIVALISQFNNFLPSEYDDTNVEKPKFTIPKGRIWLLAILCFIAFLAEGAMLDWSAVFLISSHDYEPASAGLGYAAFAIAMAFGRFIGDKVTERFGPVAVVKIGAYLAAAGFLIAVTVHWAHLELLGFVLIGLGAANIVPVLFSKAGEQPNTPASLALTVLTTLGYTGILLGPGLIGLVAQATSLSIALSGIAVLLIGVGVFSHLVQCKPISVKA